MSNKKAIIKDHVFYCSDDGYSAYRLLQSGADPNVGRSHNETALILAAANGKQNCFFTKNVEFHIRCVNIISCSGVTYVINMLIEKGADVNARGDKGRFES